MKKTIVFNPEFSHLSQEIQTVLKASEDNGVENVLQSGRNHVAIYRLSDGTKVVVKSFKNPNLINKIAYKYFRKSKAKRSYEYASTLIEKGVGTPAPILYEENFDLLGLKDSYYVSLFIEADLTYRELTTDFDIADHTAILKSFTRFTCSLHKKGIHFLDHSPGNTLIRRIGEGYDFYLVDLNRMVFGQMDFKTRVRNFSKLTIHKFMIEIMSKEYANCYGEDEKSVFDLMWWYTKKFQHKYYRKIRIKKAIFFWKKKYKNRVSKSPI